MYALFTITNRIESISAYGSSIQKFFLIKLFFMFQLFVSTYFDCRLHLTFGIRVRIPKKISSLHNVFGGDIMTIKSGKEGSVMVQYLLLMKSNYVPWSIKMRVNLQA